ncbi:Fructosamin-kin multi-domain protein [Pyrenophora teres f. teres]|uniref:protein-ribulosamine 3-kinase n=1 Tax=Pyrenophora teres f. teres TaxID=97479 RepID=A0A6S6WG83_9PLEO|nr:Fructosamin-kin multi-domain protein [Pyrenophora teres f. teres]
MSSNPADEVAARKKREREENPIYIDRVDPKVLTALPNDLEIISVIPSGASAWCETFRIDAKLADGAEKQFFYQTNPGHTGKRMMEGTYESELVYHSYCPSHVPRPIAWGEYEDEPDTWFYLCEFHDMVEEVPHPRTFVSIVAGVHKASMGKSPNGRYGFGVPTHLANVPNNNTWQDSWEAWYTGAMEAMYNFEKSTHGVDEELESIFEALRTKVIPRLLRPLETGGRSIEPCLVHSDLWPGNCMPDADTGEIMIFDSCSFWGHNECDLGSWRAPRYKMGRPFFKEYQKIMGISEPHEDWDDRNRLYAMSVCPCRDQSDLLTVSSRYDLLVSGLYPNEDKFHNLAKHEMKVLVDKYPDGFVDEDTSRVDSPLMEFRSR